MEHAVIEANEIRMRPPEGSVFAAFSAGILYGFADSNIVKHNAVRGAARAALSIPSVFPLPPCLAMRAATPSTWKKHSQDSRRLKSVRDFVDAGVRR